MTNKNIFSLNLFYIFFFFIVSLAFFNIEKLNAENIFNEKFSNFNLSIKEDAQKTILTINSSNPLEIKDLFDLENPNRIVLDVNNLKLRSNKNLSTQKASDIKQIRLGKHSNKVRFVLDLKGNKIPEFNWSENGSNSLHLTISKINKKVVAKNKHIEIKTPSPKEQVLAKNTNAKEEILIAKPKKIIPKESLAKSNLKIDNNKVKNLKTAPKKLNPIQKKEIVETDDRDQGLENIKFYFKKEKKTPLVRFMMVKKPTYTLKKKDSKKYILTIKNTNIRWPHLELPQFPPRDFRGFTMVMPERKNGNLEISIGVERDSKVTSFTKDNEIWLKIDDY